MASEEQTDLTDVRIDDIIKKYDEMFKNRYTEDDPGYLATVSKPKPEPPCVKNWYNKPKRNFDWTRDGQHDGRGQRGGYSGHRGHRGHHHGYHHQRNDNNQRNYNYQSDGRQQSHRSQGYYGNQRHRYQPY